MSLTIRRLAAVLALALGVSLAGMTVQAETVLKVIPQAGLACSTRIWTTAYITRNHGYLVYDTLFAMDRTTQGPAADGGHVDRQRRQGLTYTFTLRTGLKWHDGAPVTAARLRRLAQALGRTGPHGP